jgi:uncharacterized repeat protein (TIGR02543 family)
LRYLLPVKIPQVGGGGGRSNSPDETFTVTFDKNGGTTEASPQTKTVTEPETTVDSLPTAPKRTDYAFSGWNTAANGSGSAFTAETPVTADITVYAQWVSNNWYTITVEKVGSAEGDSVTVSPTKDENGAKITINYTLTGGSLNNRLVFSGTEETIAQVDAPGSGIRQYTIDKGDVESGNTITIIATFTHTNKNIDTIAFNQNTMSKTYGDAAFTETASTGQGSGAITYSSSHPDIATVNATTGEVTIVKVGTSTTITATKAEDETYAGTTATYTLHIAQLQLIVATPTGATTKTYDGNTTATSIVAGSLTNKVDADDVTVTATATYNSADVASANKITVVYSIAGADAGNYIKPVDHEITTGVSINKAQAPAPTGPLTTYRVTNNVIHLVAVTATGGGIIEYAVSTTNSTPSSGWQEGRLLTGLSPNTTYYVFARAKESANYSVGATLSATIVTKAAPVLNPSVPALQVGFETAISLDVTPGNGTGNATLVADPADAQEKSLQMASTNYNRGAVVPIHLPFALKNYQSFSFRFRLVSGSPTNPISVYVADAKAKFVNYGFGNPANHSQQNQQFANLLLGEVKADYSMGNEWVTYTIEIPADAQSFNTIENLQGDIFVAIGINHGSNLTILLDDLTFYAKSDYAPEPSLTPTSATFSKGAPADVIVHMNLYGTNALTGINGGNPAITSQGYTDNNDGTVSIHTAFLTTQADGPLTLTFTSSNGKTTPFVITIKSGILVTEYNFATNPNAKWAPNTPGNGSITWSAGQLDVNTGTGYSGNMMVLKFDLGTGSLKDYASIQLNIVGVSGNDLGNSKGFRIIAPASGSTITVGADNTSTNARFVDVNMNITTSGPGSVTYPIGNNAPSTTGEIEIGFYFNTNPITYRITSVKLVPKP